MHYDVCHDGRGMSREINWNRGTSESLYWWKKMTRSYHDDSRQFVHDGRMITRRQHDMRTWNVGSARSSVTMSVGLMQNGAKWLTAREIALCAARASDVAIVFLHFKRDWLSERKFSLFFCQLWIVMPMWKPGAKKLRLIMIMTTGIIKHVIEHSFSLIIIYNRWLFQLLSEREHLIYESRV